MRIPQWSKDYTLEVNGKPADLPVADGFVTVDASAAETEIHLVLDMSVRRVRASLRVRADIGKLAVARGPIVFCMEQVDNEGPLWLDGMSADAEVSEAYEPDLLEGVEVLKVKGSRLESPSDDQYQNVAEPHRPSARKPSPWFRTTPGATARKARCRSGFAKPSSTSSLSVAMS